VLKWYEIAKGWESLIKILKNHSITAKDIKNAAPFSPMRSLFDAGYNRVVIA